jgi:hypothetical protein
VHQHGACITQNKTGLTSRIHAFSTERVLRVRQAITAGRVHDNRLAATLCPKSGSMLLADCGYDADWIR